MPVRSVRIEASKNHRIRARLYTPSSTTPPSRLCILAHPYPTFSSYNNELIVVLAESLQSLNVLVLTFNFRRRKSTWSGHLERSDYSCALDWCLLKFQSVYEVILGGYSYGALVASACFPHPLPALHALDEQLGFESLAPRRSSLASDTPTIHLATHDNALDEAEDEVTHRRSMALQRTRNSSVFARAGGWFPSSAGRTHRTDEEERRPLKVRYLFVALPLNIYRYALWMFPKPRRAWRNKQHLPAAALENLDILSVWGAEDAYAPKVKRHKKHAERGWTVAELPGCGHFVDEDQHIRRLLTHVAWWVDGGNGALGASSQ